MSNEKKGIFITATGTDVGKTYVTALLLKKLRAASIHAGYYKAALSGAYRKNEQLIPGDAQYVATVAGIDEEPSQLVSYIYEPAVSPHLAAEMEQRPIKLSKIKADFAKSKTQYDVIVAEGSGGIICPLNMDGTPLMLTDVIKALHLPILIVANAGLGAINSTVLTVAYAKANGIQVNGILLNQFDETNSMHLDNLTQIQTLTGIPIVACIKQNETELNLDVPALLQLCSPL